MHIEFIDSLRCTRPHEESWLVAAVDRMEGRTIVRGVLGCPVCGAEYPIEDGVADFRADAGAPPRIQDGAESGAGHHRSTAGRRADAPEGASAAGEELAMRAAALLGLAEPGGTAVLAGAWGAASPALSSLVDVHLLLADPPFAAHGGGSVSVVRTDGALPLAAGSVRGVALDDGASPGAAAAAVRALRSGGRLVAPAGVPVPAGVTELARDARHWVAERNAAASAPVGLTRRGGGRKAARDE
jgi:uncharacterized protein YbaR (Trm112 family)